MTKPTPTNKTNKKQHCGNKIQLMRKIKIITNPKLYQNYKTYFFDYYTHTNTQNESASKFIWTQFFDTFLVIHEIFFSLYNSIFGDANAKYGNRCEKIRA